MANPVLKKYSAADITFNSVDLGDGISTATMEHSAGEEENSFWTSGTFTEYASEVLTLSITVPHDETSGSPYDTLETARQAGTAHSAVVKPETGTGNEDVTVSMKVSPQRSWGGTENEIQLVEFTLKNQGAATYGTQA